MQIQITSTIGRGRTLLSSFDDALYRCGVHNFNLIALSSVIPPCSRIASLDSPARTTGEHGDRLYVVKADARSNEAGASVAAGIGWYQWGDGRGLFVEHESVGGCPASAREHVENLIRLSLSDLCDVRGIAFDAGQVGMRTIAAGTDGP